MMGGGKGNIQNVIKYCWFEHKRMESYRILQRILALKLRSKRQLEQPRYLITYQMRCERVR